MSFIPPLTRLLWIGRKRKEATLKQGFAFLEKAHTGFLQGIKVVCSDMWKPYLKVIAAKTVGALNVLDPFPIAQHLNRAVDEVRRGEQARLSRAGKVSVKPDASCCCVEGHGFGVMPG